MPKSTAVRNLSGIASSITSLGKPSTPTIRGVETSDLFGPLQPFLPIAPPGTEARGFQYWPGQNLVTPPRPDAELNAARLKLLSQYPVARICIENVKDVITDMPRQVQIRAMPGESKRDVAARAKGDKTLQVLNAMWDYPDGEHDWSEWLRPLLEDMLVIDGGSVLNRSRKNQPEFRVISGDTITRLITTEGYTPLPPSPAYAQNWSGSPGTGTGIPFVQLTTQQLIYKPRNISPRDTIASCMYGYSPTEQIKDELEIGIGRLLFIKAYYETGTIPDMMHIVPPNVDPAEIEKAQQLLTSELAGQLQKRRQIQMIQGFVERDQPGGSSGDQFIFPKEALLSDPFDDLHIKKIAFAYGTSPARLQKMMNRAATETNQESAAEEGTLPFLRWVKSSVCDYIIQRIMGFTQYEMAFDTQRESDVEKQSTADGNDINNGVRTMNQAREDRGLDPMAEPWADKLGVKTPAGWTPLEEIIKDAETRRTTLNLGAGGKPGAGSGGEGPEDSPEDGSSGPDGSGKGKGRGKGRASSTLTANRSTKAVLKAAGIRIDPAALTPHSHQGKVKLYEACKKVFTKAKERAQKEAERLIKGRVFGRGQLTKAEEAGRIGDEIWNAIEPEFAALPTEARSALEDAILSGVAKGVIDVQLDDSKLIEACNSVARDWASERAAEMVGMKYDAEGKLVANPNAKWNIAKTTRDDIRRIVTNAFSDETDMRDVQAQVLDAISEEEVFSDVRAEVIARTEISRAQVKGNYDLWERSGLVEEVTWQLSDTHETEDDCNLNDGAVVKFGQPFPSGDFMPPLHPQCVCVIIAAKITGETEAGE